MKQLIYTSLFLLILAACNSGEKPTGQEDVSISFKSNLLPDVYIADTAHFLFYVTPGDHRVYKTAVVKDKDSLIHLMQAVNDTIMASREDCTTLGKIHFYGKGETVYTVYFNDADSCKTLSFMVGGNKYFTPMPPGVQALLYQQAGMGSLNQ